MSAAPTVALLDYGSGNVRSAQRAVERAGATVIVTHDPDTVLSADGLLVPGVGAYAACMKGLRRVYGPRLIGERLAGGRPVLGICVGMQVMFERGVEFAGDEVEQSPQGPVPAVDPVTGGVVDGRQVATHVDANGVASTLGCGEWPGTVEQLEAAVLPHMGWNTVDIPAGSRMFAGVKATDRVYFVHSYGVRRWELRDDDHLDPALVTWATHEQCRFVAAVENGPLWATQFHPEKSGDVGARILSNWVATL